MSNAPLMSSSDTEMTMSSGIGVSIVRASVAPIEDQINLGNANLRALTECTIGTGHLHQVMRGEEEVIKRPRNGAPNGPQMLPKWAPRGYL